MYAASLSNAQSAPLATTSTCGSLCPYTAPLQHQPLSPLDAMLSKGGNLQLVCSDGSLAVYKEFLLVASPVLEGALEAMGPAASPGAAGATAAGVGAGAGAIASPARAPCSKGSSLSSYPSTSSTPSSSFGAAGVAGAAMVGAGGALARALGLFEGPHQQHGAGQPGGAAAGAGANAGATGHYEHTSYLFSGLPQLRVGGCTRACAAALQGQ